MVELQAARIRLDTSRALQPTPVLNEPNLDGLLSIVNLFPGLLFVPSVPEVPGVALVLLVLVGHPGFEDPTMASKTDVPPIELHPSKIVYVTAMNDKRKQSLYFPEDMLAEVQAEATRLDRSLSWVVQRAWTLSREKMKEIPSINAPSSET